MNFKTLILVALLLIASAASTFFAIKYSSYKTRVTILRQDDSNDLELYSNLARSYRSLNDRLYQDRENEKIKITKLRTDDSYSLFVSILLGWGNSHYVIDGSNNKLVRSNK